MPGWSTPLNLLEEEFIQRRDEGVVIPEALIQRAAELHRQADAYNLALIDPIYDALMALPDDPELRAREPNELDAIRALRPEGPRDLHWQPTDAELLDRLHGAWTGRASGCALGKPVEGMGILSNEGGRHVGRKRIKAYLSNRGEWPLKDYFSGRDVGDGLKIHCRMSQRESIAYMEPDDDIHYTLVGLGVVEQHGPEFTWQDVGHYWLDRVPQTQICTAEAQAVLNLQNRSLRGRHGHATAAFTRRYRNPYREWIGAQIRADGWAYCCAGKPELAAEFAWRDAHWTHERNGVYGEMMFAAIQAAAFVETDPWRLVEIGLSEIPRDCRLACAVRRCLEAAKTHQHWEGCMDVVEAVCKELSPSHIVAEAWWEPVPVQGVKRVEGMNGIHTINNALICVLGIIFGRMDSVESIAIGVMCGLDTDCNGATIGSIVGAAAGRARFKNDLAGRLNDTIKPNIVGFQEVSMKELAARTAIQWRRVEDWARSRKDVLRGA
ncbi:MAG: ADP-ribosylglycohydrolase family protein [Polyangiaceae bacterium]|nr:ADP-ribosylglycohydrolase family protein [Polyangiaceae bacterium]